VFARFWGFVGLGAFVLVWGVPQLLWVFVRFLLPFPLQARIGASFWDGQPVCLRHDELGFAGWRVGIGDGAPDTFFHHY
jgi:hypothetical protein